MGLNWDSFKWRNYDYAIGRFMSIDPLAEEYPYNSTYAFQENKMGMGRELEGLELVDVHDDIMNTIDELGNDAKSAAKAFGDWWSETFSDDKFTNEPERSSKDISVSLRTKNGGGNNPTTIGSADEHWDVSNFIEGAPGAAKNGNKYKSVKDALTFVKDVNTGIKKSGNVTEKIMDEVEKNKEVSVKTKSYAVSPPLQGGRVAPAQVHEYEKDTMVKASDIEKVSQNNNARREAANRIKDEKNNSN